MIYFLVSILLGAIPDVLYYYLYITKIKEVKTKRIILFILILCIYLVFNLFIAYNFYFYILYDILIYFLLKFICKSEIVDLFIIIFMDFYMLLISFIFISLINNYYLAYVIYRIFLFFPLIFNKSLKNIYTKYKKFWNRNDDIKKPIKSLTLRNLSLVILNLLIVLGYFSLLYILTNKS